MAKVSELDFFNWAIDNELGRVRAALRSDPTLARREFAGATALISAAHFGALDCVKELLHFCDPNAQTQRGQTALMSAAYGERAETVRLLLSVSDARATDENGCSALMRAVLGRTSQGLECVEALLPVSDVFAVGEMRGERVDALGAARSWGEPETAALVERWMHVLREKEALSQTTHGGGQSRASTLRM